MTTVLPRRFIATPAPSATAWIGEALNRAFHCPAEPSKALDRQIERLIRPQ